MFGVVPRVMWETVSPPDELNRIQLVMRTLLVKDHKSGRVILVDTGGGGKWSPTETERFALETQEDGLGAGLAAAGLSDDDVTDVLVTHLHFDHNGGLTRWADADKQIAVPRFAKARVWAHRVHVEHAGAPTDKDRASFLARDFEPVREAGLLNLIEGDPPDCPFDGMKLHLTYGHTPGQMLPWFFDGGRELLYASDLFPTFAHLPVAWVMAYDLEPLKTISEKRKVLQACLERGLMLASVHDPHTACARIAMSGKRPVIAESVLL
jgi:glyoxylase-like metal-dependent hydrolase (beta-lactamase superfamily II)